MRLLPKAKRRLTLAGASLSLIGVLLFAFVNVRAWQNQRALERLRVQGLSALRAGNDILALDALSRYARRAGETPDPDALAALGRTRLRVPLPGEAHFLQGFRFLHWARSLNPDDTELALETAEAAFATGQLSETIAAASAARPATLEACTPQHARALELEALARAGVSTRDPLTESLLRRAIELKPDTIRLHARLMSWLELNDRKDDAARHAREAQRGAPEDARFAVLDCLPTRSDESDGADRNHRTELMAKLCRVSGLDPGTAARNPNTSPPPIDRDCVEILLHGFLAIDAPLHAASLLARAAEETSSPDDRAEWMTMLSRLAWQHGFDTTLCRCVARVGPEAMPSEALGLAILALTRPATARPPQTDGSAPPPTEEAGQTLATLRPALLLHTDYHAAQWSGVLSSLELLNQNQPTPPFATAIKALRDAETAIPDEPAFPFLRGELLASCARDDHARVAFAVAARLPGALGWAEPTMRTAESFLSAGRPGEAAAALHRAVASDSAPESFAIILRVCAAAVRSGEALPYTAESLMEMTDEIRAANPNRHDLHETDVEYDAAEIRASLLALSGRTGEAARVLDLATAAAREADPARAGPRLARIVGVRHRLGFAPDSRTLDELARSTDPKVALEAATVLAHAGQPVRAAMACRTPAGLAASDALGWSLARAELARRLGESTEGALWTNLADRDPTSPRTQLNALNSRAIADPRFLDRVIVRLAAVGGDSSAATISSPVRIARARSILLSRSVPLSRGSLAEAVALLRALILEAPAWPEPRRLLVGALLPESPREAIEQLRALQPLLLGAGTLQTQIAGILIDTGDFDAAIAQLTTALSDEGTPVPIRQDAAATLLSLAEFARASDGLRALAATEQPTSIRTTRLLTIALSAQHGGLLEHESAVTPSQWTSLDPTDRPDAALAAASRDPSLLPAALTIFPDDPSIRWAAFRQSRIGLTPVNITTLCRTGTARLSPDQVRALTAFLTPSDPSTPRHARTISRRFPDDPAARALVVEALLGSSPPRVDLALAHLDDLVRTAGTNSEGARLVSLLEEAKAHSPFDTDPTAASKESAPPMPGPHPSDPAHDRQAAIAALTERLSASPSVLVPLARGAATIELADLLAQDHQLEAAEGVVTQALETASPAVLFQVGTRYRTMLPHLAATCFEHAIERGADARADFALANLRSELGQHALAAPILSQLADQVPLPPGLSRPEILNALADALSHSDDADDLARAESASAEALRTLPPDASPRLRAGFHLTRAGVQAARKDPAGTEQSLRAAVRITPEDPDAILRLATYVALAGSDQRSEARELVERLTMILETTDRGPQRDAFEMRLTKLRDALSGP